MQNQGHDNTLAQSKTRIAITGASGMLGQALCKSFSKHSVSALSSKDLDVTSLPAARALFSDLRPHWIFHAAAFTDVDGAELNAAEAYRINALGTRNVATAAFENQCRLLYYSTDYVFDGKLNRSYREWDSVGPVNEYGRSKLAGELFVRSLCPSHLIVRTSGLFGPGGSHFVDKILQRAKKKEHLQVVDDQRGSPTFTSDLAYLTLCLVEAEKRGTYHATNSGDCSWYEFACKIVSLSGLDVQIDPVASSTFPAPAQRPPFSVLHNYCLELEGIPLLRSWGSALDSFLKI
ncbi:MAG: dTDP-4-dehydrorhamnose reductase [Acidobacteriota bacterium]